jgi:hypothetical protein
MFQRYKQNASERQGRLSEDQWSRLILERTGKSNDVVGVRG